MRKSKQTVGVFTSLQSFVFSLVSFPTRPNIKQKYSSLTELLCFYLLPGWSLPLAPCWWRLLKASRSWPRPETSRPSAGTSCDWSPKTERCVKQHELQDNTPQSALLKQITWVCSLGIMLHWTVPVQFYTQYLTRLRTQSKFHGKGKPKRPKRIKTLRETNK